MKIAVISDTHLREPNPWMEAVYEKYLSTADVLLHCGDATGFSLWNFFNQHPAFHAVAGNTDEFALADELPNKLSLDLEGLSVGMLHGWVRVNAAAAAVQAFGSGYDLICFGHTHEFEWSEHNGVHALNPGSLNTRERVPGFGLITYSPGRPLHAERIAVRI